MTVTTEKEWNRDLFGADGPARLFGWRTYRTLRSRGSNPGYPDQTCVRERVLFVELKRGPKDRPTPPQEEWLTALAKAGAEVYLWRPDDLDEAITVLRNRGGTIAAGEEGVVLVGPGMAALRPASSWLPHGGRRDGT